MTAPAGILLDEDRPQRIGLDEAVLCEQKTSEQISNIVELSINTEKRRLFTRLSSEKFEEIPDDQRRSLRYAPDARTAVLGGDVGLDGAASIAIVSAGSSDAPVAAEAREVLGYYGRPCLMVSDVGVAGLWRLLERVPEIATMRVVIAVAGMDAALPTVLAGLVPSAIIGVPCSTGYGAAQGGQTALNAMLSSCAPGLTVTNIDNGYGAACAALRILNFEPSDQL